MKQIFYPLSFALGLLVVSANANQTAAPAASVAPVATITNPAVATTAIPAATPVVPLSDADKKKLRSEFQKALSNQRSAHSHQEKAAMKELYTSQNIKQKKWREEQKKARQLYFEQHMSGPERREYVQKYLKLKEQFDASIKTEISSVKKSWTEKTSSLKVMQKDLELKFNEEINKGSRPGADFWPKNN